ncbi:MAG TPA: hypothetical protein VGS96_09255 [Thermoanaerobaculia bacterium]|jgi:hypothetical protein|nr:hypothetical protein [Thermoanaerobaculia bacterium]
MTRTLSIAAREIRERSFVFAAAGIMAVIPFASALLPYARTTGRTQIISVGGLIVSIGFTFALALVLGGSFVGRELAERRLSFYFSKPVSSSAIWFGKLAGALMTIAACFAIIFVPSFVAARRFWTPNWSSSPASFIVAIVATAVCLFLLAHVGSTMVRSRSPRVALDLLLLCVTVGAIWLILRPLFASLAMQLASDLAWSIGTAIFVAIVSAGWWQLARGRTDIQRSHAELSRFLWASVGAVVTAAALIVAWVFSAGPQDIDIKVAYQNPRGDWAIVRGPAHHRGDYEGIFLVNLTNGKAKRLEEGRFRGGMFTRRGDAAVSIAPFDLDKALVGRVQYVEGELYVERLDAPGSRSATGIRIQSIYATVAVSDDLGRVAIVERGLLSVHDLSRKALLGSVRLPENVYEMFFASPDVVRVYSFDKREVNRPPVGTRAYEFDIRTRRLQRTGEVQPLAVPITVSADGTTALLRSKGTLVVADARTLAQRFAIAVKPRNALFLGNGGIAVLDLSNDNASVRIFDAQGAPVRDIALGPATFGGIREIVANKKLLAAVQRGGRYLDDENPRGWSLYVIDLEKGVVERQERDLALRSQFRSLSDPRQADLAPVTQFVVADASGKFWRWNALTGERKKVFG